MNGKPCLDVLAHGLLATRAKICIDDAGLAAHASVFAERLRDYPAWPELADLVPCEIREVPLTDRPSEDP